MAEKILIVDDDLDTLRLVGLMLQRQGYDILSANNGQQGLDKAVNERPALILLDVMMPDMDGYEVTRLLRENELTAKIPILMFTAKTQLDDKVTGFEVGADDYLTKPTHPSELQAHVKALLARSAQATSQQGSIIDIHEHHGYVIGLLGARGGLGVSTLAVNLAANLFKQAQANVILAELTPGQGNLGMELGVDNDSGLAQLLSKAPSEISRDVVFNQLISHDAGFKLLASSNQPRDFHLINQISQYEKLVAHLASLGHYIVLDMGMGLPPFVQGLLPLINELLVVVEGASNTIVHTRALIDDLVEFGVNKNRLAAVLNNRIRIENQMPWTEIQKQLGYSIAATLTPAPELFAQASRLKTPAVLCQPDSLTSQQINKLVEQIKDRQSQTK